MRRCLLAAALPLVVLMSGGCGGDSEPSEKAAVDLSITASDGHGKTQRARLRCDGEPDQASGFGTMVPGIRLPGAARDDQARVATPGEAIELGADWLVIGRTVTAAADPEAAAEAVSRAVGDALAYRRDTR